MRQIQWVSIRIIMTAVQEVHKVTSCLYFSLVSANYLDDFSVNPNYWDIDRQIRANRHENMPI